MGVDGQLHTQAALPPGKRSVTQCTGGSLGSRAGLDWCEISPPPHRNSIPGRSTCTELLYPLRYPDPLNTVVKRNITVPPTY